MARSASRRRDLRAQLGVVVLAALAGVVAGCLGTHRSWERLPQASNTSTTAPTPFSNP